MYLAASSTGLCRLTLGNESYSAFFNEISAWGAPVRNDRELDPAREALRAYFKGRRHQLDLPLDLRGTPFQQRVWDALGRIGYGQTRSYSEVADWMGSPRAVRAVAAAVAANPVPLAVPCHRVIGKNGKLVGFGGGLDLKAELLRLEGVDLPRDEWKRRNA